MDGKNNQGKIIRQIFDTMQYGDETEDIKDALVSAFLYFTINSINFYSTYPY